MRSTVYAQLHAHKAVLCGLVEIGLLAKWLRVRVRVRAGAREYISCTFFPLWPFVSVVNTCLRWFGIQGQLQAGGSLT